MKNNAPVSKCCQATMYAWRSQAGLIIYCVNCRQIILDNGEPSGLYLPGQVEKIDFATLIKYREMNEKP